MKLRSNLQTLLHIRRFFGGVPAWAKAIHTTKSTVENWLYHNVPIPYECVIFTVIATHGRFNLSHFYENASFIFHVLDKILQPLLDHYLDQIQPFHLITTHSFEKYLSAELSALPELLDPEFPLICDENNCLLEGLNQYLRFKKIGTKSVKVSRVCMTKLLHSPYVIDNIHKLSVFQRVIVGLYIEEEYREALKARKVTSRGFHHDEMRKIEIAAFATGFIDPISYCRAKLVYQHGDIALMRQVIQNERSLMEAETCIKQSTYS